MTAKEVESFLSGSLVVEEKVDGANLGISFDAQGRMCFQNRGQWLTGRLSGQWEPLRGWAALHEDALRAFLPKDHILFGEWCHAQHSIPYDCLPDWFLGFDVLDSRSGSFWSVARRNVLLEVVHLAAVPHVAKGCFMLPDLLGLLDGISAYGSSRREGLYLRREAEGSLHTRAKLVRAEFTQSIGEHWAKKQLTVNSIVQRSVSVS
jgi:hypothetical protein